MTVRINLWIRLLSKGDEGYRLGVFDDHAVTNDLQNIYLKLHAKGRIAALKEARALGLISFD